jgi:predicted nucleotidyltransferase
VDEKSALSDLVGFLARRFGDRLVDVRLFGSRARGAGHEGSDLDVLVLVKDLTGPERLEIGQSTGDLLVRYGLIVSTIAMADDHWRELIRLERHLPREIARDGIDLLTRAP